MEVNAGPRKTIYLNYPLSQLVRSGRGEADPVPESVAAAASNRKSLNRNRRRRRRRPLHRAASSRCTAQAARAGRAASRRPKPFFAAPDSFGTHAPTDKENQPENAGEKARR